MDDYNRHTGYPFAHEWQSRYGVLAENTRLTPKIPFVLGGEFSIDNLYMLDSVKSMRLRADLALQLLNLPDGASVRYKIVE